MFELGVKRVVLGGQTVPPGWDRPREVPVLVNTAGGQYGRGQAAGSVPHGPPFVLYRWATSIKLLVYLHT